MTKLLILFILIFITPVSMGSGYELRQSLITNGGGILYGKTIVLEGAVNQTAAGVRRGHNFILNGGYWAGNYGCLVNLTDLTVLGQVWLGHNSGLNLQGGDLTDMEDFAVLAEKWFCECPMDWPLK